jgi:hypothetical protein
LLSCFAKARCRYLVVGGHALAVAGHPRFTQDLDVLVEPTPANARRVGRALKAFGFPAHADAVAEQFARPKRIATLGVAPLSVDLMTSLTGVSFARAWKGRKLVTLGELKVPFLGTAELIANKRASGRPKDLVDVDVLRSLARPSRRP